MPWGSPRAQPSRSEPPAPSSPPRRSRLWDPLGSRTSAPPLSLGDKQLDLFAQLRRSASRTALQLNLTSGHLPSVPFLDELQLTPILRCPSPAQPPASLKQTLRLNWAPGSPRPKRLLICAAVSACPAHMATSAVRLPRPNKKRGRQLQLQALQAMPCFEILLI